MPKPRALPRDSKIEFVASAWQERPHKPPTEQLQQQGTEYVPLVTTPDQRAQAAQQQLQTAGQHSPTPSAPQPAGAPSAWIDRKGGSTPARECAEEQPDVGPTAQPQDSQQAGEGSDVTEGDGDTDERQRVHAEGSGAGSEEGVQGTSQPAHHSSGAAAENGDQGGGEDEEDDWLGPALPPQQKSWQRQTSQAAAGTGVRCVQGGQGGVGQEEWVEEEEEQEEQLQQERQKQQQARKPFSLRPSEAGLSGLCRVAVLPGGHLSGHLVDTLSRKCYGVMGTQVAVGGGSCRHDEDVEFLCLALLNFSTGREVPAAVVKTGGDMAHLSPVEEGDLHRFPDLRLRMRTQPPQSRDNSRAHTIGTVSGGGGGGPEGFGEATDEPAERGSGFGARGGLANGGGVAGGAAQAGGGAAAQAAGGESGSHGAEGEQDGSAEGGGKGSGGRASGSALLAEEEGPLGIEQLLETRVYFVPSSLHAGPQAEQQLCSFAPRLQGRGAAVTVGTMRVDGQLPEGFV